MQSGPAEQSEQANSVEDQAPASTQDAEPAPNEEAPADGSSAVSAGAVSDEEEGQSLSGSTLAPAAPVMDGRPAMLSAPATCTIDGSTRRVPRTAGTWQRPEAPALSTLVELEYDDDDVVVYMFHSAARDPGAAGVAPQGTSLLPSPRAGSEAFACAPCACVSA